MFELSQENVFLIWKVSPVLSLRKLSVITRCFSQITHLDRSHLLVPGMLSGGWGRMDGISSDLRDLQLRRPRVGGAGRTLDILALGAMRSDCRDRSQFAMGGLLGWCVTTK